MKRNFILLLVFFINIIILSCNLPLIQTLDNEPMINPDSNGENLSDSTTVQPLEPITFPAEPPASDLITTEDLTYLGAFRLPGCFRRFKLGIQRARPYIFPVRGSRRQQ